MEKEREGKSGVSYFVILLGGMKNSDRQRLPGETEAERSVCMRAMPGVFLALREKEGERE